jgi:hypothetical protein
VVNPRNNGRKTDLLALITAEKEKKRLGGGEDWIRTRGCVSPEDRDLLADKVLFRLFAGNRESKPDNRADCAVQDRQCETTG